MKSAREHIDFLDYLRGVAILTVFLFHSLSVSFHFDRLPWNGLLRSFAVPISFWAVFPAAFGSLGVAMFFAISGFCIHLSHQRSSHPGFHVFFIRRFFRIYPPYLIALFFFAFIFIPTRIHFNLHSEEPSHLIARLEDLLTHILLVHNFSPQFYFGTINFSFWSIAVEAQLYLLYPVLLWLVGRVGWKRVLWITGLLEVGVRGTKSLSEIFFPAWDSSLLQPLTGSPFGYWFSWTLGAALADSYLRKEPLPFRNAMVFVWPLLVIGTYFFRPLSPFMFTLGAVASVSVMAWLLNSPSRLATSHSRNLLLQHLRWTGIVSYSAYLIHQPFLNTVPEVTWLVFHHHVFSPLALYSFCICAWLPIFGMSYLFYRYVELPSIAWGQALIKRMRPAAIPEIASIKTSSSA